MSEYYYEYERDSKYCYPNSYTLKNKLNIQDNKQLIEAERNITAIRILELKQKELKGKLDFKYLCKIHKYIFQDIYFWAGKLRTVDISKGNMFCKSQYIVENADLIFKQLEKENYLLDVQEADISERLAYYLSEINVIHPFREGNGRTQRAFIEVLANRAGYEVDFSYVKQDEMIRASVHAFNTEYDFMNKLFARITKPLELV